MKKLFLPLMLAFVWLAPTAHAQSAEVDLATTVNEVTLYHSGALVVRSSTQRLQPGVNELVLRNVSSKLVLNSLQVENREVTVLNKTLIRKLTAEERKQLEDQRYVAAGQLELIEAKFAEAGFVKEVQELATLTAFYSSKVLELKRQLRDIDKRIEEAKELENIKLANENAAILKLIVSIEKPLAEPLKLQYVCGSIGWSPAYEINVASSNANTVDVKYMARAMSQTGESWENVVLHLSSSFPLEAPMALPKPAAPWTLTRGYVSRESINQQPAAIANENQQQISQLEGVEYTTLHVPSFLKRRTLNGRYTLKSNGTVFTFPISSHSLAADYFYYGFPALDPEVYLAANVTGWDTLGFIDGVANITYKGNNVGKSRIEFSQASDTLLLAVGKDNSVFMKRTEIADEKYFKSSAIGKRQQMTLAYRFQLKNNNTFPVRFELADQVPISQSKQAEVEIEQQTDAEIDEETGDVIWVLEMAPAARTTKELVFTIKANSFVSTRAQFGFRTTEKYQAVSAPSF